MGNVIAMPVSGLLCRYGFDGGWGSVFYVIGKYEQLAFNLLFAQYCFNRLIILVLFAVIVYGSHASTPTNSSDKYIMACNHFLKLN